MYTPVDLEHWKGYFATVVTPFKKNLEIDYSNYERLLKWLLKEHMHGFVIAGTTGEWSTLKFEERCELFEASRQYLPRSVPVIAGCSALRIEETLAYIKTAQNLKMDGVLLTVPPYVCPTDREIIHFYKTASDYSSLPIIAYNWPQGTGCDFSLSVIDSIFKFKNIVALKNSTLNSNQFLEVLKTYSKNKLIFGIMPGEKGMKLMKEHGGNGCIGAAGVLGRKQPGFFEAFWQGDYGKALSMGHYDESFMSHFFTGFKGKYGHAISTFKYLLSMQGVCSQFVRPPLLTISDKNKQVISQLVTKLGLFDEI